MSVHGSWSSESVRGDGASLRPGPTTSTACLFIRLNGGVAATQAAGFASCAEDGPYESAGKR